jgi:hypothetical protein
MMPEKAEIESAVFHIGHRISCPARGTNEPCNCGAQLSAEAALHAAERVRSGLVPEYRSAIITCETCLGRGTLERNLGSKHDAD